MSSETTTSSTSQRSMVISIIGRPNVGKSSIYNRLMNKNVAITYDAPGVTRDRHYGLARLDEIQGKNEVDFILVDTGGFYPESMTDQEKQKKALDRDESGGFGSDPDALNFKKFFSIMSDHAKVAILESDLVLFVVDIREGLLPYDYAIAKTIREHKRPFWVLANKSDSDKQMGLENEFYSLGIDEEQLFPLSAAHNQGLHNLRRRIQEEVLNFEQKMKSQSRLDAGVSPRENVVSKVALIGAPNAGKSTLLNQLVGGERALVSDIPGTTVDPIQGFFDLFIGENAKLLDEKDEGPRSNELLMKEYRRFRDNNPDVYKAMTETYEIEQVSEFGGDETVAIDHVLEEMSEEAEQELEVSENLFSDIGLDKELEDDLDEEKDFLELESDPISMSDENNFDLNLDLDREVQDLFLDEEVSENETKAEDSEKGSYWRSVHLIDTAGIRRPGQVGGAIESQSVFRSLRCITESDIVIFLVDATKGISHQDSRLIDIALEKGKSVIVALNKMDLLGRELKDTKRKKEWLLDLRAQVPWLEYCQMIPISAKYGDSLKRVRDALIKTIFVRHRRVSTSLLNKRIYELVEKNSIMVQKSKGARLKVKYASQVKTDPPTFLLFVNKSKGIPEQYRKYLSRGIRDEFKLVNTPLHLIFRTGKDLALRMKKVARHSEREESVRF